MKLTYSKYTAVAAMMAVMGVLSPAALAVTAGIGPSPVPAECSCAQCGMSIPADSRFVSQITSPGKTVFFCDLGDMFLYYDGHEADVAKADVFVKDYGTGAWVDGRSAFYLTNSRVKTPMSYNILAFGDKASAGKFLRESGGDRVLTFGRALAGRIWEE